MKTDLSIFDAEIGPPLPSMLQNLLEEEEILVKMISADVRPSRLRFNRAMAGCARVAKEFGVGSREGRRALETGVRLLGLMRRAKVTPNEHTFGALIDACAKLGAAEEARAVLDMMRDVGAAPNVVAYSALLAALAARAEAGDRAAPGQVCPLRPGGPSAGRAKIEKSSSWSVRVCVPCKSIRCHVMKAAMKLGAPPR